MRVEGWDKRKDFAAQLSAHSKKSRKKILLLNYLLTPPGSEAALAVSQDLHQGRGLTWGGNAAALNLCLKNSQQQHLFVVKRSVKPYKSR